MTAVLIDTDVLVYAHDRGEHENQARAIDVLARSLLAPRSNPSAHYFLL